MNGWEQNDHAAAIAQSWVNGGAKQERERIIDLLDDERAVLIAQGDMGSPLLIFLGEFIDKLEGENE